MRILSETTTEPETCSYLHDRMSRTELKFTAAIESSEYAARLREGYRRFGMLLFRPACDGCRECIPLRVLLKRFCPSRSQRRVLRKNRDVHVEVGQPKVDRERLDLYHAFHRERTAHVGWKPQEMSAEDYRRTFLQNIVTTLEIGYRIEGKLVAVAYVDRSTDSMSSIYCFYHPLFMDRSLGTFDVLSEIEIANHLDLTYLYLGYTVANCRSMNYKERFRPAEVLRNGRWQELSGLPAGN